MTNYRLKIGVILIINLTWLLLVYFCGIFAGVNLLFVGNERGGINKKSGLIVIKPLSIKMILNPVIIKLQKQLL